MRRLGLLLPVLPLLLAACLPAIAQAARPHVVMLVFDEFPADSLLLPDGSIDDRRYPGFARLARMSTWYPNAGTVHDVTGRAVPALLTGRFTLRPGKRDEPRIRRQNLFRLLAARGWRVRAVQDGTLVCGPPLCRGGLTYRDVFDRLDDPNRLRRLRRTVDSVRPGRPTFWFNHSLLPHQPWVFLPSGKRIVRDKAPGLSVGAFDPTDDRFVTDHVHQRHLLQVGAVDGVVSRLLERLERKRMLNRTLIVVAADHGISFAPKLLDRRRATRRTAAEVAPIPLFIKAPGQRRGRRDPAWVRTTDVLPTIAPMLHVRPRWRMDGRNVRSRAVRRRRELIIFTRDLHRLLRFRGRVLQRRRAANRHRTGRVFGSGSWTRLYRFGGPVGLLGRQVAGLPAVPGRVAAKVREAGDLRAVNPRRRYLPALVTGSIAGGRVPRGRALAAALNGRIVALGRSFVKNFDTLERFSLLLPESALRPGRNHLQLFELRRGSTGYRLELLAEVR